MITIAVFAVVAVIWIKNSRNDPIYRGKKMSAWVDGLATSNYLDGWILGSDYLPCFLQAMQRKDKGLKKMYLSLYPKLPPLIRRQLPIPIESSKVRQRAMDVLQLMGAKAVPAFPALLDVLKRDEDAFVRHYAALSLGDIRSQTAESNYDQEAIAGLTEALKDTDSEVRGTAANSLSKFVIHGARDSISKETVRCLAEIVRKDNGYARENAIDALGYIGKGAQAAIPVISEALADSDQGVAISAASALKRINGNESE